MTGRLDESKGTDLLQMYKNVRRSSTRRGRVLGSVRPVDLPHADELMSAAETARDEAIEQLLEIFETNTQQIDKHH